MATTTRGRAILRRRKRKQQLGSPSRRSPEQQERVLDLRSSGATTRYSGRPRQLDRGSALADQLLNRA